MRPTRDLSLAALASAALACSTAPSVPVDGGRDEGPSEPPDSGGCVVRDADKATDSTNNAPDADVPAIAALSIAGLTLVPDFSPFAHDYYAQCAAGANKVTVSIKASSGAIASLSVETPGTPGGTLKSVGSTAPEQKVPLSLEEGQAIVATASEGKAAQEYWIRCLPHGFPPMQWKAQGTGCTRTPGYYLIGTMSSGSPGWVIVLDANGVPVWYNGNEGAAVIDVETLVTGKISYYSGAAWHVDQLSPWQTTSPASHGQCPFFCGAPDQHELRILPKNGNYLGLSAATQTGVNLTGLALPEQDGGVVNLGPGSNILACDIVEFDPTGKLIWTWRATDHFDPAKVMVVKGTGDLTNEPEKGGGTYTEPFHCNSIDVDTSSASGNLLVSARHMNSIFYIEKSTGKVLWKMGGSGPDSCLDSPRPIYVPVADPFQCQHDARFQSDWKQSCSGGSGHISLFDDESYTSNPARAVLYDVNIHPGGSGCTGGTSGTTAATRTWQYKTWKNTPSGATGSFRIGEDGSRTIGWGQSDPANGLVFTEVDAQGHDLLDLICPDNSSSYRAVKVPLAAFDLGALRSTSGQ